MIRVLVTNTKGGCGKTTVATNLAAAFAAGGLRTALAEVDRQRSALDWLAARPATADALVWTPIAVRHASAMPRTGAPPMMGETPTTGARPGPAGWRRRPRRRGPGPAPSPTSRSGRPAPADRGRRGP